MSTLSAQRVGDELVTRESALQNGEMPLKEATDAAKQTASMPGSTSNRPRLAFRVGVTGTRKIRNGQEQRILGRIDEVLSLIRTQILEVAKNEDTYPYYSCDSNGKLTPELYIVSPLARGSDRLAANVALEHGFKLRVPLPFHLTEYMKDFSGNEGCSDSARKISAEEDVAEFRELFCQKDACIELDGGGEIGSDIRNRSYEAVGRFVVRQSDLVLAIWDGEPAKGKGGTADIVHYAASAGIPVWWIHSGEDRGATWIKDIQDLRDTQQAPLSPAHMLREYLGKLLPMPKRLHKGEEEPEHTWIAWIADLFSPLEVPPAQQYFEENARSSRGLWQAYDLMMKISSFRPRQWMRETRRRLSGTARKEVKTPPFAQLLPITSVAQYWSRQFLPADALAIFYAQRYRSTYVVVIGMTTLALIVGGLAVGFTVAGEQYDQVSFILAICEFAVLMVILGFVSWSLHFKWQKRSIQYRVLAELFRKQALLAPLGWALSVGAVQHLADNETLTWMPWLFAAVQRAAPMSGGEVFPQEKAEVRRAELLDHVDEQLKYHHNRRKRSSLVGARFEGFGGFVFILVFASVAFKIYFHKRGLFSATVVCGLLAMILPGISAAFVALRGYAELQLLAVQSHAVLNELKRLKVRINRLDLSRILVSQDLGSEAASVATLMLGDVQGWGQMFRGKNTEA